MPASLAVSLSEVFAAAADAIVDQSEAARDNPAEILDHQNAPVQALTSTRRVAVRQVRSLDDTQPMLLGGALLADAETIEDLLTAMR